MSWALVDFFSLFRFISNGKIWWRHKTNEKFTSMASASKQNMRFRRTFLGLFRVFSLTPSSKWHEAANVPKCFSFYLLGFCNCLILWREYRCCCCIATADACAHIQSDSNSRTENKIPVKYLEFYSFACHVIEIFTCFFRRFFFRRDKHFDTAWQTWWWWNEKTTAETKMKRKKKHYETQASWNFCQNKMDESRWTFFLCLLRKAEKWWHFREGRIKNLPVLLEMVLFFCVEFHRIRFWPTLQRWNYTSSGRGLNWIALKLPLKSCRAKHFGTLLWTHEWHCHQTNWNTVERDNWNQYKYSCISDTNWLFWRIEYAQINWICHSFEEFPRKYTYYFGNCNI